jgi:acyl dehydratase
MYFEDFEDAGEFVTAARLLAEADVRAFAELSGDRNPIHLDPAAARQAGFAGPIAHGALGLSVRGWPTSWHSPAGPSSPWSACLGSRPDLYGDQVTLHLRVSAKRATGNPARGLVTLAAELRNQSGEVVQDGEFVELIARRTPREGP